MGRQFEQNDSDIVFHKHHPGCLWGILHILDYHHRSNLKRILPRRKHRKGKNAICCRNPKTHSLEHYSQEVPEYLNGNRVPLLVDEEATKADQSSSKARMEALIAKEMSGRLGLQAVELSHHLGGSSMHDRGGAKTDWKGPIIILQRTSDTDSTELRAQSSRTLAQHVSLSEKRDEAVMHKPDAPRLSRQTSASQFKECIDILEIFQVNKKLFLEILHDPDVQAAKRFHVQHNSTPKRKLKRSGSFPAAEPPGMRSLRPTTPEHKKTETWSFPKAAHQPAADQPSNTLASKCAEDTCLKSNRIREDNSGTAAISTQVQSIFSSSELPQGLSRYGRYSSVMSYVTDLKKKIKQALKHSKKVKERTIINDLLLGIPSEIKASLNDEEGITSQGHEEAKPGGLLERSGPSNDLNKDGIRLVKRTSSLDESLEKYSRLFEHSFNREAPPRHQYRSRSLKLTYEDGNFSRATSLKIYRRRLSMPDVDSLLHFPDEASSDDLKSEMPQGPVAGSDANVASDIHGDLEAASNGIDASREQSEPSKREEEETVVGETDEDSAGLPTNIEDRSDDVLETCRDELQASFVNSMEDAEDRSPVSVLDTHFRDNVGRSTEASKGPCLEPSSIPPEHTDGSAIQQDRTTEASSTGPNADAGTAAPDSHFLDPKPTRIQDDPDWTYVRDVLDISGFLEQDCLATWHSLDQPISPKLYKELEAYLHPEQDDYEDEKHKLLFDLVNETLVEIFETQLAYFPMQLSFAQRSKRPVPEGHQVLEEVWKIISCRYGGFGSCKDQSLNDIAARDLSRDHGWMNLRFDVEDVALDLEDVIFDELLDELIFE